MFTILLTSKLMMKRAAARTDLIWLCCVVLLVVTLSEPVESLQVKAVSLLAVLPGLFLLTGWPCSRSRNGLAALTSRGTGAGTIRFTETALPVLAGCLLASGASFAVTGSQLWQFWVVTFLSTVFFNLIYIFTETHYKYAGRSALVLLWIAGAGAEDSGSKVLTLVAFPHYPGSVLVADQVNSVHPDTFVMISLILVIAAAALPAVLGKLTERKILQP